MLRRLLYACFLIILFSTQANADRLIIEPDMGRAPLLNAIENTQQHLQLVMYGFTDPTLLEAILDLKNRGKKVDIILEGKPFRAESENRPFLQKLYRAQLPAVTALPTIQYIHQKTMILDNASAWVMTFNFTKSTFKKQRNFALVIDDPARVNIIEQRFKNDFSNHLAYQAHADLAWSPEDSRQQYLNLINQAKHSIRIYAQDISDPAIIQALLASATRGVKIEIVTSIRFKPETGAQFQQASIHIYFSKKMYIHAKALIADDHSAMVGSINFTRASLDDNRELSALTQDREVIALLIATFEHDKSAIHTTAKSRSKKTSHTQHNNSSFDRSFRHWIADGIRQIMH